MRRICGPGVEIFWGAGLRGEDADDLHREFCESEDIEP
jgi:hypothetical protein